MRGRQEQPGFFDEPRKPYEPGPEDKRPVAPRSENLEIHCHLCGDRHVPGECPQLAPVAARKRKGSFGK